MANQSQKNRVAVWLFLTLLTLHLAVTRGHFVSIDEVNMYQMTRSLWEQGDFSVNSIKHSFKGEDGKRYSQYNVGQAVAAVPLYALGKTVRSWLSERDRNDWAKALAGNVLTVRNVPARWGGDVEIFFVNLFHCFTTALLCVVFFLLCCRLGARVRNAAYTALIVGTVSYVAPFSVGFFQHSSEALFVLTALYFLVCETQQAQVLNRALAGLVLGLAFLFRQPAAIVWPAFGLYFAWIVWQHHRGIGLRDLIITWLRKGWPFVLPMLLALIAHFAINYIKFGGGGGGAAAAGEYNANFNTLAQPGLLLAKLYFYLFSPGLSIFLFTPLLVLLPWTLSNFWRHWRAETLLLMGLALSYFAIYISFAGVGGLTYGPRYLMPLTALLLLPMATWLDTQSRRVWLYLTPLLLLGFWMTITHVAVNVSFAYHAAGYGAFRYPFSHLSDPYTAPVVQMSKALLAGDYRVDMWLLHVYRKFGFDYLWKPLLAFVVILLFSGWRLQRSIIKCS